MRLRRNNKWSWPLSCNNQHITIKSKSFKQMPCQQQVSNWSLELQGSLYTTVGAPAF